MKEGSTVSSVICDLKCLWSASVALPRSANKLIYLGLCLFIFFANAASEELFLNCFWNVTASMCVYDTIRYGMIDDLHWKTDRQAASLI